MSVRTRVGAIILNKAKTEIVLIKHSGLFPEVPVFYTLPGGGVEEGESMKEAAKREVQEECGLTVEVGKMLFLYDFIRPPIHSINHYFLCDITSGDLTLGYDPEYAADAQMILSVGFYPIEKLHEMEIPVYPLFLKEQLQRHLATGVVKTEYLGVFTQIM